MPKTMRKYGFTLIELIIVVAIIAVLAAVVVVTLNGQAAKARDTRRIADTKQISAGIELFYNANLHYIDPETDGLARAAWNNYSPCLHESESVEWTSFSNALKLYTPNLSGYDGRKGKRYCSGNSAHGAQWWSLISPVGPTSIAENYQIMTELETEIGNGPSSKYRVGIEDNLHFVVEK